MNFRLLFVSHFFLFFFPSLYSQKDLSPVDSDQFNQATDEYIYRIDSLIQMKLFEKKDEIFQQNKKKQKWNNPDTIPVYPEIFYEYRLAELNKYTPIELDFNEHVKKNIEMYTINRRKEFSKIRGLSYLYFPIMEEYLLKHDLPLELKYISVIESSLNPLAKSKSGAVGLWQFLPHSGKLFDLEISSYIDERKDPYKSTDAACRYLKYLHKIFNDCLLTIAAYNGGPGEVRNAILYSGGKTNFWEIRKYMREETQNYVPKFIAACYVMNYADEHNIPVDYPSLTYYDIDTLKINSSLSFQQISEKIDLPVEIIRFLNPSYTTDFIPDFNQPLVMVLPQNKISEFIRQENRIYANRIEKADYMTLYNNAGSTANRKKIIHTVEKGEFFHKIAVKYNCSIENIKAWNKIGDNSLYPGQKLDIWVDQDFELPNTKASEQSQKKYIYYTVQKGDTLWSIAEKFKCKTISEIISLNGFAENETIKPGQKIKVTVNN